jgi:hypothetical protein
VRLKALAGLILAIACLLCGPVAAQSPVASTPVPAAALAPPPQSPGFGSFQTWAAIVVAGDFHAHSGALAETFDNARRELAKAFVNMGFASDHVSQFSGRPERYPAYKLLPLTGVGLFNELKRQAAAAPDGCLIYFTSHGNGEGILFGDGILTPEIMKQVVDGACGTRPTVVFISACFSGVFMPALAAPNRMIMTAARSDRSSFGCQEEDEFTFFDNCVLSSLPSSRNFVVLSAAIQACVAKKEGSMRAGYDAEVGPACNKLAPADLPSRAEAIKACLSDNGALTIMPPSEPQISIGAEIRPELTLLHLDNKPDS